MERYKKKFEEFDANPKGSKLFHDYLKTFESGYDEERFAKALIGDLEKEFNSVFKGAKLHKVFQELKFQLK